LFIAMYHSYRHSRLTYGGNPLNTRPNASLNITGPNDRQ
jgi:hypothetical protein